jgi:DNA-binding response OmpR family regulator
VTTPKKLLVIEDEQAIIELMRHVFDTPLIEVITAETGDKGLINLVLHRPDVVILDLMLPGVAGWDIYDFMRGDERFKITPVIIFTVVSRVDRDRVDMIQRSPVDYFVPKPFEMLKLRRLVQELLGLKIW